MNGEVVNSKEMVTVLTDSFQRALKTYKIHQVALTNARHIVNRLVPDER
jgi:hypothetical protein